MAEIADVDYKKVLVSEVAPDGGIGVNWKKIQGFVRQGTASLVGSDATVTPHKNVLGGTIKTSVVQGDNNFNFQCADISAETRAYFMGGTVETSAEGVNYKAPEGNQDIKRSIMIVGKDNTIDYAANVNITAYIARADDDLAYMQVNGLVEDPEKVGEESQGSWEGIDADANSILAFSLPEESSAAIITEVTHDVAITVPTGTDLTALVPTIGVSLGANAVMGEGASATYPGQATDFTTPVTCTVESANGGTQAWTITVTEA